MNQNIVYIRPDYVKVGGDLVVGSLLSKIVWWHEPGKNGKSKLRVWRHGCWWIAKTREEWMEECCITRKQYLRAMAVLKQKNLVEVRVMKFGGVAMNHLRLIRETLATLLPSSADSPQGYTEMFPQGAAQLSPEGTSIYIKTNIQTKHVKTSVLADDAAAHGELQNQEQPGEKEIQEEKQCGKSGYMEPGNVIGTIEPSSKKAQGKEGELVKLWKSRMSPVDAGHEFELTCKERKQLQILANRLGAQTRDIITWAVENWWTLVLKAKNGSGTTWSPNRPHIGFLLKYYAYAVLAIDEDAKSAEKFKQKTPQPIAPPGLAEHQEPKEVPATLEEVKAIMKEFAC